jgi:hypothetical protein
MVKGKLLIHCAEMSILATMKPWIRECQELVCPDNEIVLDDGTRISFVITFPKALVRWRSWGNWLVDKVGAKGVTKDGGAIFVTMEKERVARTSWRTMDAQPCNAVGTVELCGKIWKIGPRVSPAGEKSFFPKCTATATGFGFFRYVAAPVTAEGVVELN